jgi:hypothetical protein
VRGGPPPPPPPPPPAAAPGGGGGGRGAGGRGGVRAPPPPPSPSSPVCPCGSLCSLLCVCAAYYQIKLLVCKLQAGSTGARELVPCVPAAAGRHGMAC